MHDEPRQRSNSLDVVLKVAERCNLACPYCYYFYQENDLHKTSPTLIPESTIRDTVAFLRQGAQELNIEHLYIGFHGGEPLLLPKKRFDALCRMMREGLSDVTNVHLGLQTNGTRVDAEWIQLFGEHKVMVGVSLDGPPHIHNAARPDHKGRGSYDAAVRGLRLLQEAAGQKRIPQTGILCVVNPDHNGEEVIRHFVEELGIRNLNLLLPREGHDSEIWKPQSKWIRYFSEVIRYWQSLPQDKPVFIYILSEVLMAMLAESAALRNDYRRSNRHSIMTITSDGYIGPDDNLMALDKALARKDATVRNTTLAQFVSSPLWQELVRSIDTAPEKCQGCEWNRLCRSGELFNRYQKGRGFNQPSVFCELLDSIHTSLASIVAQRENGLEDLTRILANAPGYWARDFLQAKPAGVVPAEPWVSEHALLTVAK